MSIILNNYFKERKKTMKKIIALILFSTLLVSMSACGNSTDGEPTTNTTQPTELPTNQTVTGDLSSTTMFDVTLTPEWSEEEDSRFEDTEYSTITYNVIEGDEILISLDISLETTDVLGFRDSVKSLGIDLYDYAINGAGDKATVAGYDCVVATEESWGDNMLTYVGRDEKSGTTLEINISGDYNNELVSQLLSTINPKIEDLNLVDYPYFWDGEPFSTENLTSQINNFTITSENIKFESPIEINDIFSARIAKNENSKIYLGYDNMLWQYDLNSELTNGELFPLENDFSEMESDDYGNLFVSEFGSSLLKIAPDKTSTAYSDINDMLSIHPSGEWGLTYFVGSEVERVNLINDTSTVETFIGEDELFTANKVRFTENHIILIGTELDNDIHKVMVLDNNKTPLFTLGADNFGDNGYFGAITDVVETSNGFIVADGNFREFHFYDLQGTFIGSLSDKDILGTSYPWISDMQLMDDGSVLIAYSEERLDSSGYELLITRMTGF